jgi:hypothetical protein
LPHGAQCHGSPYRKTPNRKQCHHGRQVTAQVQQVASDGTERKHDCKQVQPLEAWNGT